MGQYSAFIMNYQDCPHFALSDDFIYRKISDNLLFWAKEADQDRQAADEFTCAKYFKREIRIQWLSFWRVIGGGWVP